MITDAEGDVVGGALLAPVVHKFVERLVDADPGIRVADTEDVT